MPLYNTQVPPSCVNPGDDTVIVNNEQLGANNFSQQVNCPGAGGDAPYGFTSNVALVFTYASAPAAVEYDIYVAMHDVAAEYVKVGQTTNVNGDLVTIAAITSQKFRFVRVKEVTSPGVNATVKVCG
jgi:hypothetical protein